MKGLIRNYIDLLDINKLNEFGIKNDIHLNNEELEFLLKIIKENYEDILVNDFKYLELLKNNINQNDFEKIQNLFKFYKERYKGYLF